MKSRKFFSMVLPVEVYQELRKTAFETDRSMSGIIRQGIDIVLRKPKCNCSEGVKGN